MISTHTGMGPGKLIQIFRILYETCWTWERRAQNIQNLVDVIYRRPPCLANDNMNKIGRDHVFDETWVKWQLRYSCHDAASAQQSRRNNRKNTQN